MITQKTSFSIPDQTLKNLEHLARETGLSVWELAMGCLKILLRRKNIHFIERNTTYYNPDQASRRIYPRLSYEEQVTLRTIRACHAISISYLISLAVNRCLPYLLRKVRHNYAATMHLLEQYSEQLKHIHRKINFQSRTIAGFTTVVCKPKPRNQ